MPQPNDLSRSRTALDQDSTLIAVIEMSQASGLVGALVGTLGFSASVWLPLALAPLLAVLYVWTMRPLLQGIPLPGRMRTLLSALRLVPG